MSRLATSYYILMIIALQFATRTLNPVANREVHDPNLGSIHGGRAPREALYWWDDLALYGRLAAAIIYVGMQFGSLAFAGRISLEAWP